MTAKIRLHNASFDYGERNIFRELNFEVESGDILCLLGSNGCGKTTLLRCLRGFLKLKTGSCYLDETDISSLKTPALAQKMGFVFQEHSAPFPYSVIEVVKMGRAPHLKMFASPTKHDREIAEKSLETVGISHLKNRRFTQISGGERQLVVIARTLAQGPDIILMDEPTSALDFKNQALVLRMINKLAKQGITIIISTHFPNHAMLYSCKVAMMNEGHFVDFGPAERVITEDNLKRTYGIDVKIFSADDPTTNGMMRFCVPTEESADLTFSGLPGIENVFYGEAKQENGLSYVELEKGIRIEAITHRTGRVKAYITSSNTAISTTPHPAEGRNVLNGEIKDILIRGEVVKLEVQTGVPFTILITHGDFQKLGLANGGTVYLMFKNIAVQVYEADYALPDATNRDESLGPVFQR
jgi:iron complex transport system ATP-binding protein